MLTRFLDAVAVKVAAEWLRVSAQGLVFWGGGVVAWAWHSNRSPLSWLQAQAPATRASAIVALLLAVAGSAVVVRHMAPAVLRLLEGYGWPRGIRGWFARRQGRKRERLRDDWARLQPLAESGSAEPDDYAAFVHCEATLRRIPAVAERQLPTWVGNTLRAAEGRPYDKYRLDPVKCWPHLWLVLPQEARSQFVTARTELDSAVCALMWAAAYMLWTPWAWWAAPVSLLAVMVLHRYVLRPPCAAFADLLEAAFDLYRPALYAALRWPLPRTPAEERRTGQQLTVYLWRGSERPEPTFTIVPDPEEGRP